MTGLYYLVPYDCLSAASSPRQKIEFLRSHTRSLARWPVACAALVAGLWGWSVSSIEHEERGITESAYFAASAQARTYAEQLERSIGQLDYIMLSLQFHRQKSGSAVRLEEQVEAGLVPKSSQISVSIFDRTGLPVTSTSSDIRKTAGIANSDYFNAHAANPSKELVISKPGRRILSDRDVIILSRRLDAADGTFAGVMVVAVEPSYLASFVDETQIGKDDFISIRRSDGAFFVAKTMEGVRDSGPNFRGNPQFSNNGGIRLTSASHYVDGKERIVAWHAAKSYPVVSVVGLSVASQLAGHALYKREAQLIASLGSLALFLVAAVGVRRSACQIWRTKYSDEVHKAYRLATENAREGFYMLRALYGPKSEIADFLVEDCNERGALYLGLPREALIGSRLSNVLLVLFESHMLGACRTAMADGFYEDEMHVPPNGSQATQWLHRRLIRSEAGLAVTLRDVTETKAHQDALACMANEDALTSLPNRYWLTKHLPEALGNAKRHGKRLAIMFVDLDDFKDINDTLGHAAGDELLKLAALRLKALIRPEDMVARLGGDEFTIVVGAAETSEEVISVAEHIIAVLSAPYVIGVSGQQCTVHASIGISMFPGNGEEGNTLLKQADMAMYSAKARGKGSYCFFESRLEERLIIRVTNQIELKQAIDRGDLVLYYQPRVKATTGELTSMEALVRWIHPARGLVPPDEFIPLAEETGLIVLLGAKVIDMACAQLAQWKADGLQLVPVSINVSAKQIDTGGVSSVFAAASLFSS
ncbi:MAG: diguanylate cyclase [Burkholderia sp.]|nr:diguanylate cyclase [Burkholderia sp.]